MFRHFRYKTQRNQRTVIYILRRYIERHLSALNPMCPLQQQFKVGNKSYFVQRVEKRLVSLLKNYCDMEFENNEEYLDSIGNAFNPPPIQVCGSLRCQVRGEVLNTQGFIGGIGLSMQTVKEMEIVQLDSERIVIIENLMSYYQWIHQRKDCKELVIYTGGFPHRRLQIFLARLADYLGKHLPDAQVVHLGEARNPPGAGNH